LSKKLAGGADALLLDIKCGKGAFMKNNKDAQALANTLVAVSETCGMNVKALITPMDEPLGWAIGNALEVMESIEILKGQPHSKAAKENDCCQDTSKGKSKSGLKDVDEKYYRLSEVTKIYSIPRTRLYELMDSGELHYSQIGGTRHISQSALQDFMKRHERVGECRYMSNKKKIARSQKLCESQ
jgi:hypothetical protein